MSDKDTPTRQLPDFANREERAAFGDTHCFTDYLDDLEPSKMHLADEVTAPLTEVTQVRLDKTTNQRLATIAKPAASANPPCYG